MTVIERIAFHRGRRDEVPNQELARELAEAGDREGVAEIAEHLWNRNPSIASDCIKVLYETGYIDPFLIEGYTGDFLRLLKSGRNRMVWGGMIALSTVADARAAEIWEGIDDVVEAVEKGSVITVVSGVRTLAIVASKDPRYEERLFPFLVGVLRTCKPKLLATHAEDMMVMVNDGNRGEFTKAIEDRMGDLSGSQMARVRRVMRR